MLLVKDVKKHPPIKAPADKDTRNTVILLSDSFLKKMKKTATQTHSVIKKVDKIIDRNVIILFVFNYFDCLPIY